MSKVKLPAQKAGFLDWIVSTGANLYHDMHHAMNLPLYRGSPFVRDRDSIVALPILKHYALAKHKPRRLKRLYHGLPGFTRELACKYFKHNKTL